MPKKRKRIGRAAPRGSSKAGRPRKDGDRYPGGQLKPQPVTPNERIVAERRELLGDEKLDISKASDPLDFAEAKGFITLARSRAATAFADAYRQAISGAPGMGKGGPAETVTTTGAESRATSRTDRNQWDGMSRSQIAAVFDQVFNVTGTADHEAAERAAMRRWRALQDALSSGQRSELFEVCVLRSWPQWMVHKARGQEIPDRWDAKRVLLESGLDLVIEALKATARAERMRQRAA